MATVQNAAEFIRLNKAPFWQLSQGEKKIRRYTESADLETSIADFESMAELLSNGKYSIKTFEKDKDQSGNYFAFSVTNASPQPMQAQSAQPSTNPYNVPDTAYQAIMAKARQELMMEQMHASFMKFMEEWPDYKKKIDTLWSEGEDTDGNGIPDFLEQTKKVAEIAKTGVEVKKMFDGNIFG